MSAKIIQFRPRTCWTPPQPPQPPVGCVVVAPIRRLVLAVAA